jgi:hypothetical protein
MMDTNEKAAIARWQNDSALAKRRREELMELTIIYRMLECGDQIPINTDGTDYKFIEPSLQSLYNVDMIQVAADQLHWEPTQKAVEVRNKMVGIYDQLQKFEIFGAVNLCLDLPEDVSEDGIHVFDHCYDPRFQEPSSSLERENLNTQDLRLTMIGFLHGAMSNEPDWPGEPEVNQHRVVFFQKLADGDFNKDVWFDLRLGKPFDEIEEIAKTAYPWQELCDDLAESETLMQDIYTAGMLEQRKRDGCECSGCGIPLAVFEMNTKEDGEELTTCPNPDCGASFNPPEPEGDLYECPNCQTGVGTGDHQCRGCGAVLDFSHPPGTVIQETVEEESVWHDPYYDYVPYGYYSPYDPFYDMMAFGLVCAVLW